MAPNLPDPALRVLDLDEHCPTTDGQLIGGKAVGLLSMIELGLRVPPAFVITSRACRSFLSEGELDDALVTEIDAAVSRLEKRTGCRFGDRANPLLVSVRSGAEESMPGMMDTVLNLGINADIQSGLAAAIDDAFADACRVRFLAGFASVVLGVRTEPHLDAAGTAAALGRRGVSVPSDPRDQLLASVRAVFGSWNNERACAYRDRHGHDHDTGTAVVVQMMAFGNRGAESGTGVVFSRNPNTGEPGLHGDYLAEAQGEDVVDGTHATMPIGALADRHPALYQELRTAVDRIERHVRDVVDVEFTVDDGVLYFLQCRAGKRAAPAAVRIAVELVDEGLITVDEALRRVSADQIRLASRPMVAIDAAVPIASGLGVCPGVASGEICLSADAALAIADADTRPVILVRRETSPADVQGMMAAAGVVTTLGGSVSHAALVARELDIPTVVGVGDLRIDMESNTVSAPGVILTEGDAVTIDGATGDIYRGMPPTTTPAPDEFLERLRAWQASASRPST